MAEGEAPTASTPILTKAEVFSRLAETIQQGPYSVEVTVSDREDPVIRLMLFPKNGGYIIVALSWWLSYAIASWQDSLDSPSSTYEATIGPWVPDQFPKEEAE